MEYPYSEYECNCNVCVSFCYHRPCWGTVEEMKKIIDAGYGNKLMQDYWSSEGEKEDILIIVPAVKGFEQTCAPFFPTGKCAFLNNDNLCILHDKKLKPIEGRITYHVKQLKDNFHEELIKEWDTEEGRKLVDDWKKEYFMAEKEEINTIERVISFMEDERKLAILQGKEGITDKQFEQMKQDLRKIKEYED